LEQNCACVVTATGFITIARKGCGQGRGFLLNRAV